LGFLELLSWIPFNIEWSYLFIEISYIIGIHLTYSVGFHLILKSEFTKVPLEINWIYIGA